MHFLRIREGVEVSKIKKLVFKPKSIDHVLNDIEKEINNSIKKAQEKPEKLLRIKEENKIEEEIDFGLKKNKETKNFYLSQKDAYILTQNFGLNYKVDYEKLFAYMGSFGESIKKNDWYNSLVQETFKNVVVGSIDLFTSEKLTDYLRKFLEVMPKYGIKILDRELACAPFNSEEGRKFMELLMESITYWSKVESIELAKKRGNLPYYHKSFYQRGELPFRGRELKQEWHFDWEKMKEDIKKSGIRNGYTTIIAPTGSISMIAGCSSGIEPVYSLAYEKNVKVGSFYYTDPAFEKVMREEGLYGDELMAEICDNKGSVQNMESIPAHLREVLVTAMDITPEDHIRSLASFQKWVDSSISKTNNFPVDATVDHMRESYIMAYKLGCKDVTVFRDSSIKDQVLVAPKRKEKKIEAKPAAKKVMKEASTGLVFADGNSPEVTRSKTIKNCPECGHELEKKEGCVNCPSCGWGLCM